MLGSSPTSDSTGQSKGRDVGSVPEEWLQNMVSYWRLLYNLQCLLVSAVLVLLRDTLLLQDF